MSNKRDHHTFHFSIVVPCLVKGTLPGPMTTILNELALVIILVSFGVLGNILSITVSVRELLYHMHRSERRIHDLYVSVLSCMDVSLMMYWVINKTLVSLRPNWVYFNFWKKAVARDVVIGLLRLLIELRAWMLMMFTLQRCRALPARNVKAVNPGIVRQPQQQPQQQPSHATLTIAAASVAATASQTATANPMPSPNAAGSSGVVSGSGVVGSVVATNTNSASPAAANWINFGGLSGLSGTPFVAKANTQQTALAQAGISFHSIKSNIVVFIVFAGVLGLKNCYALTYSNTCDLVDHRRRSPT